jgi:hypothetical protein
LEIGECLILLPYNMLSDSMWLTIEFTIIYIYQLSLGDINMSCFYMLIFMDQIQLLWLIPDILASIIMHMLVFMQYDVNLSSSIEKDKCSTSIHFGKNKMSLVVVKIN